ncbi:TPA: type-F conjugative transfer system pilin assembly thiol-disulfide isomerase TrbB [Legionella pneumophila]|nr:type-F conjugative transfer system pilin assembly thiol-disulfide isomerase TrbB [Legionella pneumophila]
MRAEALLSVILAFMVSGAFANTSQWLAHMIAEHEQASQYREVKNNQQQEKGFFSTHGLILFYGSQCPHCQQFAPILKHWAFQNKAEILPLSLDNQPLPEFPKFLPATTEWINAAFGGSAIQYPALFIINPKTQALYPVGFGSMTVVELDERMRLLIPKIKTYEKKGRMQ